MNRVLVQPLPLVGMQKPQELLPLRLDQVCFAAGGQTLIDQISLTLSAGARTVILGPNGAGKSLLLRLCHGLLMPSAGNIHWASDDPQLLRQGQAMVFQRPVLLRRSAAANIDYALLHHTRGRKLSRRSRQQQVMVALAQVGLSEIAHRPARVLSGGEQQRLALARAWALRPQVLFLDEPTASLDPGATRMIEEIITAIHHQGCKIIMTTHDLGQARRHADEVVFMHRGRLLAHQPAGCFFSQPESREARDFMAGELLY